MILILEGPNKALRDDLRDRYHDILSNINDTTVVRHSTYEDDAMFNYFSSMLPALTYDKHVILDGSWYSEFLREDCPLTTAKRRMLERAALSRQALVVFCSHPDDNSYDQLYNEMDAIPEVYYDGTAIAQQDLDDAIDTALNTSNPYYGGGMWAPGGILVLCSKWKVTKEKHRYGSIIIPYITFSDNDEPSASNIITNEFDRLGIPECDLYWSVIEDPEGNTLSPMIVDDLNPRQVIAIGHQARLWAQINGVDAAYVKQPYSTSFTMEGVISHDE